MVPSSSNPRLADLGLTERSELTPESFLALHTARGASLYVRYSNDRVFWVRGGGRAVYRGHARIGKVASLAELDALASNHPFHRNP